MIDKNFKVLIVENSDTMRMVCYQMLSDEGFNCEHAATAEDGLVLLSDAMENNEPFSGMLLDWILPKLSGAGLMEKIMADERFHELAVMIFTERPDKDTWRIAVARGNADIQLKEELKLLPQRMRKFLTLHSSEAAVDPARPSLIPEDEHGAGEKILLVDDSPTICANFSSILQEAGYQVVTANSMKEGIEVARAEKPKLAVLDYYMPGGNGDELCRKLLADPQLGNIVVIMFSQRKEVMEMALEAGAMDLIYKDDPLHIFLKRIGAIMQLIRSQRNARQTDLLKKSMDCLGVGVMLQKGGKFSAFNQPMRDFAEQCGDLAVFSQLPATGEDLHVKDTTGQKRYFEISQIRLSDHEQASLVLDITTRRRAEGQVKRNHEMTQKILEVMPVGVAIIGQDKIVRSVNKAGLEMMGRSKDEVVGHICHKNFCSTLRDQCPACDLGQTVVSSEKILLGASGEEIPILKTVLPLTLVDEEVLLKVFVDISSQKEAERTLIKARKQAEDASRAKSDFLANMSHEIRTPMNAVIGLTHLALQTKLLPKQEDYLTKIETSANSLLGIINDILDFSKIEAGHLTMEEAPFRLNDVMANLANVTSVNAEDKDIEILFQISDDTPSWLKGDPLRLGQILINLTNNAIKFTKQGEVLVSSRFVKEDEGQATLEFSIKDSGIGMTPEQQSRLFTAFSQADTSTTRKFGGTGLGLSISKRLVEIMGGVIKVQSEAGQGSEFSFTVTLGSQEPLEETIIPGQEVLEKLRILVVDDNSTARTVIKYMLSNMGAEVALVASGQDCLDAIQNAMDKGAQPYDLILMDWKMPGMDGVQTTRKIRAIKTLPVMPTIIMATAYGHEHVRNQARDASLDGFLMKPISPQTLAETICQAIGKTGEIIRKPTRTATRLPTGLKNKRILLVEDNLINQQVAYEILKNAGIRIEIAENGVQAVKQVKDMTHPFDAILMDVMMPEMDGLEATRHIRTDLGKNQLPIIAMTASVMQNDLKACLDAGMDDVVAKPINVEQLFVTLKKWLNIEVDDIATQREIKSLQEKQPDLPDELVGIDLQDGLIRLAGNKGLLRRMLLEFARNGQTMCDNIRKALDDKKWKEAHRFTHDIKGVAGNLGISNVYGMGQELELALKENRVEQLERLFDNLQQEISTVLKSLEILEKAETDTVSVLAKEEGVAFDKTALTASIKTIAKMLEKNNLAAAQAFEGLQQQLTGADVEALLMEINSWMGKLDFRRAAETLGKLALVLKIPIDEDME